MITDSKHLQKLPKDMWYTKVENAVHASSRLLRMCEIASTESALGQSSTASRFKMIWLHWFESVTFCRLEILYY